MTPGIPGTGIGGLFYILGALLMPIVEIANRIGGRGRRGNVRLILNQFAIASGILVSLAVTAMLILPAPAPAPESLSAAVESTPMEHVDPKRTSAADTAVRIVPGRATATQAPSQSAPDAEAAPGQNGWLKMLFIFGTAGVLLLVLSAVQVLRFVVRREPSLPNRSMDAARAVSGG